MESPLRSFGDYILLGELGQGAMGVVYQARHVTLNRSVALKLIRPGRSLQLDEARRFSVEAEAAASLDHPNIVPIFEVGEHAGELFLCMKLIPGGTLAEAIENQPISSRRATELLVKIADAVEHAHQRGVLHRDLKPGNILLDDEGQPHLTDFGMAKLRDGTQALTQSNTFLGTPAYMAPEVAVSGSRVATISSDIYSLGAVLYQVLTGRPPFIGNSPLDVLEQVKNAPPPSLCALKPDLPRDLETICLKCMRRTPGERYATAGEMAADLNRFLRGEPIQARQPTTGEQLLFWIRRHRVVASFSIALLVCLAIGLGGSLWQWQRAEHFLARSEAAAVRLKEDIARRDQREAEALFVVDRHAAALKILTRLVRENPFNKLASARLFSALVEYRFLWPSLPPMLHDSGVEQGVFTPDGTLVLIAAQNNLVHGWDLKSAVKQFSLPHHTAAGSFALSRDGRFLATISPNGTACVWQMRDRNLLFELSHRNVSPLPLAPKNAAGTPARPVSKQAQSGGAAQSAFVTALAFNSDGSLVAAGTKKGQAGVWSTRDGTFQSRIEHGEPILLMHFHPKYNRLLTVGATHAVIWDLVPNIRRRTEFSSSVAPTWAEFSPDGERLLTSDGQDVVLWNAQTGHSLHRLKLSARVNFACFSPDGSSIATANENDRAQLFYTSTGVRQVASRKHSLAINKVRFSHRGDWLITASEDGTARAWHVQHGGLSTNPIQHEDAVRDALFNADDSLLLTVSADKTARVWQEPRAMEEQIFLPVPGRFFQFSPDGDLVAAADTNHVVTLFHTSRGQFFRVAARHSALINCLAFSPDGVWLASGDEAGNVVVTDILNNDRKGTSFVLREGVKHLQWDARSELVAAAASSRALIWQCSTRTAIPLALQQTANIGALGFSPDGRRIAVAAGEPYGQVFDTQSGVEVVRGPQHPNPVLCLRFAPNNHWIATGSQGKATRVWDAVTGRSVTPLLSSGQDVTCLSFAPDSRSLLAGSEDGIFRLWQVPGGAVKQDFPGQGKGEALSGEFSPDGEWVALSGGDHSVKLYHVATLLPGAKVVPNRHWPRAWFSKDGQKLLMTNSLPAARILKVPSTCTPDSDVLLAMSELLLGQKLNRVGGWEDLTADDFTRRKTIMTNALQRANPPNLLRTFRFAGNSASSPQPNDQDPSAE